jgi:hypothetical protein
MPYPHEPSRPLTEAEWNSLRPDFPQMDRKMVRYWGKATLDYNCLAWSLGIQSSWIWHWGPPERKVTLEDFYALYRTYWVTQKWGPIDLWGKADNDMKHGSIWLELEPPRPEGLYTSKMGGNILLVHYLADIAQGMYGTPKGSAGPERPKALQEVAVENIPQDSGSAEKPTPIIYSLSEEETPALMQQVKKLNQEVKDLFEQKYAAWKQTWTQPAIQVSSNPNDYARSQEFNDLVAMGRDILPLLVEKMSNGREFLVLQAVEQLLPSSLIFRPAIDDPHIFGGEQLRAHMTAKRWLASL